MYTLQNPRQCLASNKIINNAKCPKPSILFFLSTYLFFKIPALNAHETTRNWSQMA